MTPAWLRKLNPRRAEDPTVAVLLWLVAGITALGVGLAPGITGDPAGGAREAVLKGAGGILLLLGSYFAARTLKQTRADQRANRALQAIQLLGHEAAAVRVGALWILVDLANSSEGPREHDQVTAIKRTLAAACESREAAEQLAAASAIEANQSLPEPSPA